MPRTRAHAHTYFIVNVIIVSATHTYFTLISELDGEKIYSFTITSYVLVVTDFVSLCSLFLWNNESVNIWSHFTSFVIFFGLMLNEFYLYLSHSESEPHDNLTIILGKLCLYVPVSIQYVFLVCIIFCLVGFNPTNFNALTKFWHVEFIHYIVSGVVFS